MEGTTIGAKPGHVRRLRQIGCGLLVSLPLAFAGSALLIYFGGPWRDYFAAVYWTPVPALIESVEIETSSNQADGDVSSVICRYSYKFAGRNYAGARVSLLEGSAYVDPGHVERRRQVLADCMESEKPFMALVNPAVPQQAVLFRDKPFIGSIMFICLGFTSAALGIVLGVGTIVGIRREKKLETTSVALVNVPLQVRQDRRAGHIPWPGPLGLAGLWGAGVFLLVWFSGLFGGFVQAGAPWWALAFVGMFVLLAVVVLLGAATRTISYLLYRPVELILQKMPILPGGTLEAAMRGGRRLLNCRAIRVRLECASITVGEHSTTKVLHSAENHVGPDAVARQADGTVLVPISLGVPLGPGTTETGYPRIRWQLVVQAHAFPIGLNALFELPVSENHG